jgi:hypothetical protein
MTTININFYALAALVGDEYDGWTPPSVVEGWIDTLVAGHVLTSPADVFADTRNKRSINLTLIGDIDQFLSDDWVYIIPAGTRVSLVVTEPAEHPQTTDHTTGRMWILRGYVQPPTRWRSDGSLTTSGRVLTAIVHKHKQEIP